MIIKNFKKLTLENSSKIASFDVDFGMVTVRDFSLFGKSDGSKWISEPSRRYTDREGAEKYQKIAVISDQFVMSDLVSKVRKLLTETTSGSDTTGDRYGNDIPF